MPSTKSSIFGSDLMVKSDKSDDYFEWDGGQ